MAADDPHDLFRRSYGRGIFVFGYGAVWLMMLVIGFHQFDPLLGAARTTGQILLAATVASALAGGVGGATAMLQRLARHLSVEQNFQHQSLLPYLLQPLTGIIAGIISLYGVALPGALLINYAATRTLSLADVTTSSTFVALQLLLAWIAGHYQTAIFATMKPKPADAEANSVAALNKQITAPLSAADPALDSPLAFKIWFEQRQRLSRWSIIWGFTILFYGLVWLISLGASLLRSGTFLPGIDGGQPILNLLAAGWPAAAAGGVGGVVGMFYNLYQHISFEQDFDRQHLMAYLILPVTGLILGAVMYLFIGSGYLSFASLSNEAGAPAVVDAPTIITLYLVLGWLAGFRQQSLDGLVRRLIQSIKSFFRFCLSLLSPKNWTNKTRRADTWAEIARQTELFKPLHPGAPRSSHKK